MVQTKRVSNWGTGVVRARQPEMAEVNNNQKIKTKTQIPAVRSKYAYITSVSGLSVLVEEVDT